jgi:hypothetical protein
LLLGSALTSPLEHFHDVDDLLLQGIRYVEFFSNTSHHLDIPEDFCSSEHPLYSSIIYRLKLGFGRFFRGLVTGMFCFGKTLRFGRTRFS